MIKKKVRGKGKIYTFWNEEELYVPEDFDNISEYVRTSVQCFNKSFKLIQFERILELIGGQLVYLSVMQEKAAEMGTEISESDKEMMLLYQEILSLLVSSPYSDFMDTQKGDKKKGGLRCQSP